MRYITATLAAWTSATSELGLKAKVGPIQQPWTPDTTLSLVLVLADETQEEETEGLAASRLDMYVSLVNVVMGSNAVHEHLFENSIDVVRSEPSATTKPISVSAALRQQLEMSDFEFGELAEAQAEIARCSEAQKRRIYLSLHWFNRASRTEGVDCLLQYWIALEAIAYDGREIQQVVVRVMGRIYSLSQREVRYHFGVGPLHGFRSRIVHAGERLRVPVPLTDYMRALVLDVLRDALRLRPKKSAGQLLAQGLNLEELLNVEYKSGFGPPLIPPIAI